MNIFGGTSKSKLSETHFIEAGLINMLIKITQVQNHLDFSFCLVNGLFHISGLAIVSCMKLFLFNLQSWIFQIISYCLFLSIIFKFNDDFSPWRWFICACKFFFLYSLLTVGYVAVASPTAPAALWAPTKMWNAVRIVESGKLWIFWQICGII